MTEPHRKSKYPTTPTIVTATVCILAAGLGGWYLREGRRDLRYRQLEQNCLEHKVEFTTNCVCLPGTTFPPGKWHCLHSLNPRYSGVKQTLRCDRPIHYECGGPPPLSKVSKLRWMEGRVATLPEHRRAYEEAKKQFNPHFIPNNVQCWWEEDEEGGPGASESVVPAAPKIPYAK